MKHTDRRADMPAKLVGAAHFDRNADDFAPAALVRIAKQSGFLDELRSELDFGRDDTVRKREPGDWALAFLAFASSPIPDLRPWWRDSSTDLWWEAGFKQRPSYDLLYKRFVELQERGGIDAFFEASAKLIRLAIVSTKGLVCRDMTADGTEAEANARMFHDCQSHENCPGLKNRRKRAIKPSGDRSAAKLETSEAKRIRGKAAEVLPDDEHAPLIGDADELVYDNKRELLRIRCAGHWWRITDPTAGCRTKEGARGGVSSWIGHTDMKLDCMLVGLSAVRVIESASTQEYDIYPTAYEKLKRILDGVPRSVVADKGLSIKRIFQMHSDDGVFSVIPFRGGQQEPVPVDRERWDRYGRPRCENCGGVTRFVSFTKKSPARVFFECARKPYDECDGRQQLRCSKDPRFILPLWRGTALYGALEDSGMEYERTHRLTRQRHGSGGNNFATRPKRKGRDWQQLIANASIVSDWLKLAWRNGWLPGTRTHASLDVTRLDGAPKKDAFDVKYADKGLNGHYGERAAAFRLGPWRVKQYYRAELKDAESQAAPKRPLGGPRRRALTPLPPEADDRVNKARKQFFTLHASPKSGAGKAAAPTPGGTTSGATSAVPSVEERQRERMRRGRERAGPEPPG